LSRECVKKTQRFDKKVHLQYIAKILQYIIDKCFNLGELCLNRLNTLFRNGRLGRLGKPLFGRQADLGGECLGEVIQVTIA